MPILTLQRRQTEVGRIRIGEQVATAGGKTRPAKLDKFRITTASRRLADQVAALYGGEVKPWQSPAGAQWEIYTDTKSLPVVVPPQDPITQWYELWSGGGCQRRCDGQTETKSGEPCICGPDAEDRPCKPTTRLNVMLAEVPSIGVWRLESHGYYAAIELPGVADVLASAGGYIEGRLELQQRTSKHEKRGGGIETRQYMVPVLDVNVAPANLIALNAGTDRVAAVGGAERPAIGSAPADAPVDWMARVAAITDEAAGKALWAEILNGGEGTPELNAAMKAKAAELRSQPTPAPQHPVPDEVVDAEIVDDGPEPDASAVWQQILATAGDLGWSTSDTQRRFKSFAKVDMPDADGRQLAAFLAEIKGGGR